MAAPVDSLEGKVEYALLAVLSDGGLEDLATLYCGHEFEEAAGAQILITCLGGPEMVYNSGNYLMRVRIAIRSSADRDRANETTAPDPREVHRRIIQTIRNTLHVEGIEALLSEQEEDFTCNQFYPGEPNATTHGRYFETELEYECDCVRADLT